MADEIRRRKTTDPEMDAMMVLTQAFAELDRSAIKRILKWADDRYVSEDFLMPKETMEALTNFQNGMIEVARRLGSDPRKVLIAMERIANEIPKVPDEETVDVG